MAVLGAIHVIPPHTFAVVPRQRLERVARRPHETQLSVAALNEPLRFGYGRNRVGGLVLRPVVYADDLLLPFIIARGEIDGVESVQMGGKDVAVWNLHTHNGIASPPVEPWLSSAWAIAGWNYLDTLPNIAHGVIKVTPTVEQLSFDVTVVFRGLKVYDPRAGGQTYGVRSTYAYSTNPVLALADFIDSHAYGKGETVDWTTVTTCANVADELVSGVKRREFGLMIDRVATLDEWEEALKAYAGVWLVREGGTVRFVADAPASPAYHFTNAAGSANYLVESLRLRQRKRRDSPTIVTVQWTDTTVTPWAEREHTEKAPGVDSGTVPWRESVVPMHGIQNASQAKREALRRLNEFLVADFAGDLISTGNAVQLRKGDVIQVTDSGGLSAKQFRLVEHRPAGQPGLWREAFVEYDPQVYSDAVATSPASPDTTLPSPTSPTPPTGLTLVEEVYQIQTGRFGSRINATWTAPVGFPFVLGYSVELTQAGTLVESGFPTSAAWTSNPIPENLPYTVTVRTVSLTGATSEAVSGSITNSGKTAIPSDVPAFSGYEVSGEVRLEWTSATDLDLTGHEIRYSSIGGTWSSATLVDRVATPARRYTTRAIPPGTWRFWIKGLDSVRTSAYPHGQESANALYVDIDVTTDQNAYVASSFDFVSPTLFNMATQHGGAYVPGDTLTTSHGGTFAATFTSALATYTNPLASYHSAAVSGFSTEAYDIGASVTGDFYGSVEHTMLAGTSQTLLDLNNTGPEAAKTITNATNATPIVITTSAAHGYTSDDEIEQSGILGNTAANGFFKVTVLTSTTYSLQTLIGDTNVAGNGAYTSGGTAKRWVWTSYPSLTAKTTARFVRMRLTTSTDGTAVVTKPGSFRALVVTRKDGGPVTCAALGPTVFVFSQPFNKAVKAFAGAVGSAGEYAEVDRIEVNAGRGIGSARFIRLNGTTQYVTMGDLASLTMSTGAADKDFTVEGWCRPNAIGVSQILVAKSNDGVTGEYTVYMDQNGLIAATVIDNTAGGRRTYRARGGHLQALVWQHFAAVYTASSQSYKIYIDGLDLGTDFLGLTGSYTRMRDTAYAFMVGAQTAGNYFGGGIDEVRLWTAARSLADIAANKNNMLTSGTNLQNRWGFDETSGTGAADSVGSATGTVVNTPANSFLFRPYNGLDVYRFNASGAQVAGEAFVDFEGV